MTHSGRDIFAAVDLGAGSGRVVVGSPQPERFLLQEVRRFHYAPSLRDGRLEWPLAAIFDEIQSGLRQAGEFARGIGGAVTSVGVDSWGVDYGLIDRAGNLCENPVCYRDRRTEGVMEKVFARVPREEIYTRTGIQFMAFNTLFQLSAHAEAGIPNDADRLLLIPDLIHFLLTQRAVSEFTNATTTQMVHARDETWDLSMLSRLALPTHLLAEIVPSGTNLGLLRSALAADLNLEGTSVVAPATHDTASAVAGTPLDQGYAFISSGTWSLAGVERSRPLINAETARHNFTNEGGAFGTTRFLKNVMGLWILESCRNEWNDRNMNVPYDALFRGLDAEHASSALIYPDDSRFFAPPNMLSAIAAQMRETGQTAPDDPAALTKIILDSLALRCTSVIRAIESLTGDTIRGIHIVGGGSQNAYLNQATATASGLPVIAGPIEATATGNILVQAISAGNFAGLEEARRYVAAHTPFERFSPRPSRSWEEAAQRYAAIEACYADAGQKS